MFEKVKIEKGLRVKHTVNGRIGKVQDVYDNMAAVKYGQGVRITPTSMLKPEPLMKKNVQVEHRISDGVESNMLIVISPEGGIQKSGKWTPEGKRRFFEKTKAKGIKVAISLNGTFCMTEEGWERLKITIDAGLYDIKEK